MLELVIAFLRFAVPVAVLLYASATSLVWFQSRKNPSSATPIFGSLGIYLWAGTISSFTFGSIAGILGISLNPIFHIAVLATLFGAALYGTFTLLTVIITRR